MKKIAIIAGLLLILAIPAVLFMRVQFPADDVLAQKANTVLSTWGFTPGTIGEIDIVSGNAELRNVALDKDGFSTIGVMRFPVGIGAEKTLEIENLTLTGGFLDNGFPVIGGWTPTAIPFPVEILEASLQNGTLDLMDDSGALRLTANAKMLATDDGGRRIDVSLKGDQRPLGLDSSWIVNWQPDGHWVMDGEISSFWLKLENTEATRVNGWMSLTSGRREGSVIPTAAGQMSAGLVDLGDVNLNNFSATIEGPLNAWHIIIDSGSADHEGLQFSADLKRGKDGVETDIAVMSENVNDLLDFLTRLHSSLDSRKPIAGALMGLLITDGNLKRVRKELSNVTYDRLELQIKGPLYDMNGKIIAIDHMGDLTQRHIISLNPGLDAGKKD